MKKTSTPPPRFSSVRGLSVVGSILLSCFTAGCNCSYAPLIIPLILVAGLAIFIYFLWLQRHVIFIERARSIEYGMTLEQVKSIMKAPYSFKEVEGDKFSLVWEKRQWKGFIHGGTITRRIKVVFNKDEIVLYTQTRYFDISVYF